MSAQKGKHRKRRSGWHQGRTSGYRWLRINDKLNKHIIKCNGEDNEHTSNQSK